jgi:hypothetical protein
LRIERRLTDRTLTVREIRRRRELDANLWFRARAGSVLPVRFVADSLLEGAGFEPPVPLGEATVRDRFVSF